MSQKQIQPPSIPPYQGGSLSSDECNGKEGLSPSPDKGRARVGFLPYNKNLTSLARQNRRNPTPAESKIWREILRMRQFAHYKFLRQKPLGGYIVDFYCAELRLVIEIDGDSHAEQVAYDEERTRFLNALGLQIVRFTNDEVLHNIEGVYDNLSRFLPVATETVADVRHLGSDKAGRWKVLEEAQ
jgi:very-short-patch-repair endonuclease